MEGFDTRLIGDYQVDTKVASTGGIGGVAVFRKEQLKAW